VVVAGAIRALGHDPGVTESSGRRNPRRWKDMSRVERYAFVQHQVLFLALYVVAVYLVATNAGVGTAIFVFGGGILVTAAATFVPR
jgi:hypothetical protein